ncbi:MAG: DsbA family protein [Elusimicrobia bacterium]|nr:DsbA family protein [Elusimicrobiota bacterium]
MRLSAAILSAALLAGRAYAYDKKALEEHIRETYQIPGEVGMVLGDAKASEISGFDLVPVTIKAGARAQEEKLFLSKDGRHYVLGGFKDLKVLPSQERIKKMDLRNSPVRGKADATITVVQYTDFQCPYCQKGYQIMKDQILKDYDGKVRWVYKSLPLGFHDWAEPAAMAAECAKLQGHDQFWKMHDMIFDKQDDITTPEVKAKMDGFAKEIGADEKAFAACYDGKKTMDAVRRDVDEAQGMGISGTPAFLVNGRLISGADYGAIKRAVDDALKRQGRGG